MRDRLIEKLTETFDEQYEKRMLITPQHTADSLLADGWIRLPCKVGDKIYRIVKGKIKESEVEKIEITKNIIEIFYDWHGMGYELSTVSELGKTVFLTREEAEAKLKEGKG